MPAIISEEVTGQEVRRIARRMSDFYANANVAPVAPQQYVTRLDEEILRCKEVLLEGTPDDIQTGGGVISGVLGDFLSSRSGLLAQRVSGYFVRDGHGDLRPEHVCLDPQLQVIDCLEFDSNLRYLDCLEEMTSLGMESRLLGAAWVEDALLKGYREYSGDTYPAMLAGFYAARRALTRAMLMVWRSKQGRNVSRSLQRARSYLQLAQGYLDEFV